MAPFDPSVKTKWYVIDRVNGRGHIATFDSPAFFSFHTANAWEEVNADGTVDILANIVQYQSMDILHKFYYKNMISTGSGVKDFNIANMEGIRPYLVRYKLGSINPNVALPKQIRLAAKIIEMKGPMVGDLPTYNPQFMMRKNRYVYAVCAKGESSFVDGLAKADMETQTSIQWTTRNHTPGEPIFVADPGKDGEDDGVILSVVLDGDTGLSYLLCLDARTFTEIGRAQVPNAVGFGFHGKHLPV